jgi:hypothetical protein
MKWSYKATCEVERPEGVIVVCEIGRCSGEVTGPDGAAARSQATIDATAIFKRNAGNAVVTSVRVEITGRANNR